MKPPKISPLLQFDYGGGRKRIFIGLLLATCTVVCLALLALLIIPWLGEDSYILPWISISVGCAAILAMAWLCLALVVHIHTGRTQPGIFKIRHLLIRLMLPLMEIVGKYCGVDKEIVRRSFIKVNNELVISSYRPVPAHKILLLLPHCIQASSCPRRLAYTMENCAHCGNCQIGELLQMSKEYGFAISVATGGTIARRIVVECAPAFILAVACERDLSSGIQDSYPIPVFGILNNRPHGPCRDTLAPLPLLRNALAFFLGQQYADNASHIETCGKSVSSVGKA